MNRFLLFSLLLIAAQSYAQNIQFHEIQSPIIPEITSEIKGVYHASSDYADVDNDGDLDFFSTGVSETGRISELYLNDGDGSFTISTTSSFASVYSGTVEFQDIDNDGDSDLYISGLGSMFVNGQYETAAQTVVYTNDGLGNFVESSNNLLGLTLSDADFFDMDGDADFDLIVTGFNNTPQGILSIGLQTILYENDGSGNFSEVTGTTFAVDFYNRIETADLDGDSDNDIVIMNSTSSTIFLNDGLGNFTPDPSNQLNGFEHGELKIATINSDAYPDIIVIGASSNGVYNALTYLNDGLGNFTSSSNNIEAVDFGTFEFSDIDGDTDLDLITSGKEAFGNFATRKYLNDGQGYFVQAHTILTGTVDGSIELFDVDGDATKDLILLGKDYDQVRHADLFVNNGFGIFSDALDTTLNLFCNNVSFGDIDSDGDLDLYLNTLGGGRIYEGVDSSFTFKRISNPVFLNAVGYNEFDDVDLDGDLDIISSGHEFGNASTNIYLNDGLGSFQESLLNNFVPLTYSTFKIADIDNDGQNDLLILGSGSSSSNNYSNLYRNSGGVFSEISSQVIPGFIRGNADFSDMDLDGDLDLFIAGSNFSNPYRYENDGTGNLMEISENEVTGVAEGGMDFGDIDNDGDEDLITCGSTGWGEPKETMLYFNDGNGNFTLDTSNSFLGGVHASVDLIDIDLDGDLDLFETGDQVDINNPSTQLYLNDGTGNFTLLTGTPFVDVNWATLTFADLDQDLDQDVIIAGWDGEKYLVRMYRTDLPDPIETEPTIPYASYISVFPNPSNEDVSIKLPEHSEIYLTLSNIQGEKVLETTIPSDMAIYTFDVSEFAAGIYLLQLNSETIEFKSKLLFD